MFFRKKQLSPEEADRVDRTIVIEYMRKASADEYKKILKIIDIYRNADEQARIAEYGSKKAANEAIKANETLDESDNILKFEEIPE